MRSEPNFWLHQYNTLRKRVTLSAVTIQKVLGVLEMLCPSNRYDRRVFYSD